MSDRSSLLNWLENAGLEKYYPAFKRKGLHEGNFIQLPLAEYESVGITDHTERVKLFKLIQVVKRELGGDGGAAPASSAPRQEAPSRRIGDNIPPSFPVPGNQNPSLQYVPSQQSNGSRGIDVSDPRNAPRGLQSPRDAIDRELMRVQQQKEQERQQQEAAARESAQRDEMLRQQQQRDRESQQRAAAAAAAAYQQLNQAALYAQPAPVPSRGSVPSQAPSSSAGSGAKGGQNNDFSSARIRVALRKRPLNKTEAKRGEVDIASVYRDQQLVVIHEPKVRVDLTKFVEQHQFVFDEVFGEEATNAEIYARTCKPMVSFFLNKGKATCFAYGQTGSGKTYTMMGAGGGKGAQSGLYVLAAHDMFEQMQKPEFANLTIWVSFFEIYGGKLFDLLNNRQKLVCREDGQQLVNIVGLREQQVTRVEELLDLIAHGNSVRATGVTGANVDSSRSHAILQIAARKVSMKPGQPPKLKPHGKFSFIDLAGSERAADTTNNDRATRLEGAEINKSLLALKECIRALDQDSKHRPFRGSKLTQVLKDSLIGNSRTIMVANISPNSASCEHTLNTLRYADRVRELKADGSGGGGGSGANAYMPHQPGEKKSQLPIPVPQYQQVVPRRSSGASVDSPPGSGPSYGDYHRGDIDRSRDAGDGEEVDLTQTHTDLCNTILKEEDILIESHRQEVDATMQIIKNEMGLIKKMDNLAVSTDEYVAELDLLLVKKMSHITELREKLQVFRRHLDEEKILSETVNKKKRGQ